MSTSIVIADDQALVRAGFRMILEAEPDLRVVAEAKDGERGGRGGARCRPDVVLMDIRMPGWTASRRPAGSSPRPDRPAVLMLTTSTSTSTSSTRSAGASGFLLKDVAARAARCGHPRRRRRRGAARAVGHPPPDRGVRPRPPARSQRRSRRSPSSPRASSRSSVCRPRPFQRRDRRPARRIGHDRQDTRRARSGQARAARPRQLSSSPTRPDRHGRQATALERAAQKTLGPLPRAATRGTGLGQAAPHRLPDRR